MLAVPANCNCLSPAVELRQIFAEVNPNSCPKKFNFHLHTQFSDGKMEPCDLVDQAIALGVQHFAITDHHTIEGYLIANEYLQSLCERNPSLTGMCRLSVVAENNNKQLMDLVCRGISW